MEEKKVSGIKGITWREDKEKWIVRTTVDRKPYPSKCFSTLSEAKKFLKKLRPDLFGLKITRKDPIRKQQVKEAKEEIIERRLNGKYGIKYVYKTDKFEVYGKRNGERLYLGSFYDFNKALERYIFNEDLQIYWLNNNNPRPGARPDLFKKCWVAYFYIKGKFNKIGEFKYYFEALDARIQAEEDNPEIDRDI